MEICTAHEQLSLSAYLCPSLPSSLSLSPLACLQHLPVRSTFRFNLNKFQLDFPSICSHCSHFVTSFFYTLFLLLFFPMLATFMARLVACWSCCCLCWCCCFSHFPHFSMLHFHCAFSVECFVFVRVVHWRARACRDSRWPLLHLVHGRQRERERESEGGRERACERGGQPAGRLT